MQEKEEKGLSFLCGSCLKGRTPEEYQELLNQVQLSEQDTRALFNLMDVNRDGKLSTTEFEHGVRLFAPSTALEDIS